MVNLQVEHFAKHKEYQQQLQLWNRTERTKLWKTLFYFDTSIKILKYLLELLFYVRRHKVIFDRSSWNPYSKFLLNEHELVSNIYFIGYLFLKFRTNIDKIISWIRQIILQVSSFQASIFRKFQNDKKKSKIREMNYDTFLLSCL